MQKHLIRFNKNRFLDVSYVCNMVFPRKGSIKMNIKYLSTIHTWKVYIINIYIQFDIYLIVILWRLMKIHI